VRELFERISAIKAKAEQSEELVSDVCRDIKSLDIAKRNLTLTVTALKRLVMLVTALEQLRTQASCRQYDEAAGLIHAVEELAGHFLELRHVARVADLLERKAGVLGDLRQQLLDDYASLLGGAARQDLPEGWGAAAASCVDALGPSMRREVVTQFCLRILEDYKEIFQPPKEASQLETAERRYAWLKRAVRDYEERHAHTFPSEWRVQCGLCMHFCHVTRQHLVEVLSMTSHMVDPELMVRVLRKSIDFENELARKYPADERPAPAEKSGAASTAGLGLKYPDAMGKARPAAVADDGEDAEFAPRFKGIISECFDAYLGTWVRHEERQLLEEMSRGTAPGADEVIEQGGGDEEDDDGSFEPKLLYKSATTLFASMKGSMTKCAGFSTHNTLFDVFQVFRKAMSQYTDRLEKQLPKVTSAPLEARDVQRVCCVIGTAEYCDETLPQLADSLLQVIDPSFEEKVTFTAEQDGLHQLMNRANETLVLSVGCSLDEAFSKMTRTAWASFSQDVGDHSPYVGDISERLPKQLGPVSANLSKIHYLFFCDKFVQSFVARFVAEIYRCRKISEQGAQQLLLDTSLIKTTLLEAPVVAGQGRQMQTAYSRYVLREMGRAEAMLKVLSSPDAVDASQVASLLGEDGRATSEADVQRLLALRASSDLEPPDAEGEDRAGAVLGSTMTNFQDALNKRSEEATRDFKKLSGDVKKNLQKLGFPGVNLPGISRKGASSSGGGQ